MQKDELKEKIADILEIDPSEMTDDFVFDWEEGIDSLALLGLIAFFSESFDKNISKDELFEITTLQSLMELVCVKSFED